MSEEVKEKSVFEVLSAIDVNGHTEKKNNLTYLSWAWAWAEVKKAYPDSTYRIYENAQGWNYFSDGRTCWVKTGVTVKGIENIEYLPVMDFRNKSIPANAVTSFDVNKAIQRSLTKAIARHGLGLYIYAGEDLPEQENPVETVRATMKGDVVSAPDFKKLLNDTVNEYSDKLDKNVIDSCKNILSAQNADFKGYYNRVVQLLRSKGINL